MSSQRSAAARRRRGLLVPAGPIDGPGDGWKPVKVAKVDAHGRLLGAHLVAWTMLVSFFIGVLLLGVASAAMWGIVSQSSLLRQPSTQAALVEQLQMRVDVETVPTLSDRHDATYVLTGPQATLATVQTAFAEVGAPLECGRPGNVTTCHAGINSIRVEQQSDGSLLLVVPSAGPSGS